MVQLRTVILDVDGTLVDSNDGHVRAWVEAMSEHGYKISYEEIQRLVGMGGDNLLPNAIGVEKDSETGQKIDRRQKQLFRERYLPSVRPFPQARDLLLHLRQNGLKLVVATSASQDEMESLLDMVGVADLIESQTSSADAARSKPNPDIVQAALDRSGFLPAEALMLGDTPYDVQAAAKIGVRSLALRSGGFSDADLAGAAAIFDDVADLLAHYSESPLAIKSRSESDGEWVRRRTNMVDESIDGNRRFTTDHETIRQWVVERGGLPAMVRRVGQPDEGELVINFPNDGSDEPIIDISWADFFQRFDDKKLAFVYSDRPSGVEGSRFCQMVARDDTKQRAHGQ